MPPDRKSRPAIRRAPGGNASCPPARPRQREAALRPPGRYLPFQEVVFQIAYLCRIFRFYLRVLLKDDVVDFQQEVCDARTCLADLLFDTRFGVSHSGHLLSAMMPSCSFRRGELAELAEGARLLSEYRRIASYLGFESPALRQKRKGTLPGIRTRERKTALRAVFGRAREARGLRDAQRPEGREQARNPQLSARSEKALFRGFEPVRGKQPCGLFSAERGKREVCAMRSARKGASRRGIPSSPPEAKRHSSGDSNP